MADELAKEGVWSATVGLVQLMRWMCGVMSVPSEPC